MAIRARADFDTIRVVAFGAITGAYTTFGVPVPAPTRSFCVNNDTDASMYLTNDITRDKIFVKAGGFKLWDVQSNMNSRIDDSYALASQWQWYIKYITAPTSGSVYLETLV